MVNDLSEGDNGFVVVVEPPEMKDHALDQTRPQSNA